MNAEMQKCRNAEMQKCINVLVSVFVFPYFYICCQPLKKEQMHKYVFDSFAVGFENNHVLY